MNTGNACPLRVTAGECRAFPDASNLAVTIRVSIPDSRTSPRK